LPCHCPAIALPLPAGGRQAVGRERFLQRSNHLLFNSIEIASTLKARGFDFIKHFLVRNDAKALGIIADILAPIKTEQKNC